MKHLHTLSIAFSFKTATTACGKRVKADDLAITQDTDCPTCRKHAEDQFNMAQALIAEAVKAGREAQIVEVRKLIGNTPAYRNAIAI